MILVKNFKLEIQKSIENSEKDFHMDYKNDDSTNQKSVLTILIDSDRKERKKLSNLIIDDICSDVANFYSNGDESSLKNSLDSLSLYFKDQKIVKIPQSFDKLGIMNILMTIIINQRINFDIFKNSISSLKYIFQSNQMCSAYIKEDIIKDICSIINDWEKIFSFGEEKRDNELICVGDLIQIINSFLAYDNLLINLINSILPIQFLIKMPTEMPFCNPYEIECFSSYFFSFIDMANDELLDNNLDSTILFFNFCQFCFEKEIKQSYQYNLCTISELVCKLEQKFNLEYFIKLNLNEFVNSALLEDDDKIIFQAIHVISAFHSPFNKKKIEIEKNSMNEKSSLKSDIFIDECFLHFPNNLFNIENLVVLPVYRDEISHDTRFYSIIALKNVFKYNCEHLFLFFKYEMPKFFISHYKMKKFAMKKEIVSLFLFIIEVVSDELIDELIDQGLLNMFIDFIQTGHLIFEIFVGIKLILDRFQSSGKFPFIVVLLQDESFQNTLEECIADSDQQCASLAKILKDMTFIEDEADE